MTQALPTPPLKRSRFGAAASYVIGAVVGQWRSMAAYYTRRKPTFWVAFWPLLTLVAIAYVRDPRTNYIFDEQEALLGNPYVNQTGFAYSDAIYRDFWGLPANASIGSYRPIPNLLWRGLVEAGERGQVVVDERAPPAVMKLIAEKIAPEPVPTLTEVARRSWFQDLYNLLFHAACGAAFTSMAWRVTGRRLPAWITGLTFVTAAILTEAVSGVVGLADVLGGLGALAALAALSLRAHAMPFGVFLAISFGLFSKESAIVCVPLVPLAALLFSPVLHPSKPARIARTLLAGMGALAAFVLYAELRKRWFPSPLPEEHANPLHPEASALRHVMHDFFVWFHQAPLPRDPLNNPLVDAPVDLRVGGALRVYFRGLCQVVFPWTLSGDYSYPQEPIPDTLIFPESVLGWAGMVLPLGAAVGLFVVQLIRTIRGKSAIVPAETEEPEPLPEPKSFLDRVDRAVWNGILSVWPLSRLRGHGPAVRRALFEAWLVAMSVAMVRWMLKTGPSDLNKDMGDTDPTKIVSLDEPALWDLMAYGAVAAIVLGVAVEVFWQARKTGETGWRIPTLALGFVWLVVSYFPHSNIVVLLPTVRAERLWYFPVLGTTMVIALVLTSLYDRLRSTGLGRWAWLVPTAFLLFQGGRAYVHAMDYRDDLTFWKATKEAVPMSAKAHLNYSVMVGARGDMDTRLFESEIARKLAPKWAMAHIYTGDTLCRMNRPDEAWPHYAEGFKLGPNDKGLISLALQCLWDQKKVPTYETQLRQIQADNPGSWIAYLADDIIVNGDKQGGVQKEHRPRSYNEGPKEE